MFNTIKDNRAELVRGSVLDPNNHPSYSASKVDELNKRDTEFKAVVADMREAYGYNQ